MGTTNASLSRSRPAGVVVTLCAVVGAVVMLAGWPVSAVAQYNCGGTTDCPSAPLPLGGWPTAHTEADPGGHFFAIEGPSPDGTCFDAAGYITGANQLNVGSIVNTVWFTNPVVGSVSEPTIEAAYGEGYGSIVDTFPVSGSVIHAAGVACVPGIGGAFAITDTTVGSVWAGQLIEHALPGAPLSAAVVAICFGRNTASILCVETDLPSIETYLAGVNNSFPLPGPSVALPDTYTNGQFSGVVSYALTSAHLISGGMTVDYPYPPGGTYVSHSAAGTGITIVTTQGSVFISLAAGTTVVPFSPCDVPLVSCPAPSPSGVAMNMGPCIFCAGSSATWPAGGASCFSTGGLQSVVGTMLPGPTPGPRNKRGYARASAWTSLAGPKVYDPPLGGGWGGGNWNSTICWFAAPPPIGAAGAPSVALAVAVAGGDGAVAFASIGVVMGPTGRFVITAAPFQFVWLVHTLGHGSSTWAIAKDPLIFDDWDDAEDLEIGFALSSDTYCPVRTDMHPDSTGLLRFEAGSSLPGLERLYEIAVVTSHDGASPTMTADFSSNPLLGLDDAVVAADIAAAFTYSATDQGYTVAGDTPVFTVSIDIPPGLRTFEVTTDLSNSGEIFEPGYVGPEPSPPTIGPPYYGQQGPYSALVFFESDELVRGRVHYGLDSDNLDHVALSEDFSQVPFVELTGLERGATYYFAVEAIDLVGMTTYDDSGGAYYTLSMAWMTDYVTEQFGVDNDLEGLSLVFVPDEDSVDFYAACVEPITELPTDPSGGTDLALGDDDFQLLEFEQAVSLYGNAYSGFYVGSNGYLTFGEGDATWSESLEAHFALPRISALFDDLNPTAGGAVSYQVLADRVAVTYEGVYEYAYTEPNTFQVEVYFDGTIVVSYLDISAIDGLAGLSQGLGVGTDFFETDLSRMATCSQPPTAYNTSVTTTVGAMVTIELPASDEGLPDPPGALDSIITSLPTGGALGDPEAGFIADVPYTLLGHGNLVMYSPNDGYGGPDAFEFKVGDGGTPPLGGESGTALVSIWVLRPGDLNCDGAVNFFDIDAFVLAITSPTGYEVEYPDCNILNGDCNFDGSVNFFDIDAFVELVIGG